MLNLGLKVVIVAASNSQIKPAWCGLHASFLCPIASPASPQLCPHGHGLSTSAPKLSSLPFPISPCLVLAVLVHVAPLFSASPPYLSSLLSPTASSLLYAPLYKRLNIEGLVLSTV